MKDKCVRKISLFLILLGYTFNLTFSTTVDSLQALAENSESIESKIEYLIEIALYFGKNSKEAIPYFEEAHQLAKEYNLVKKVAEVNNMLGYAQTFQGNYLEAKSYFINSLEIAENIRDSSLYYKTIYSLALTNYYTQNYDQSRKYYEQCIRYYTTQHDSSMMGNTYNNLGLALYRLEDYELAMNFYKKALAIKEATNHPCSMVLNNIASVASKLKNYDEALKMYNELQSRLDTTIHSYGTIGLYINIGSVYHEMKDIDKALDYHHKAYQLSKETGYKRLEQVALQGLAEDYKLVENYKQALHYFEEYKQVSDSLVSLAKKKAIEEIEAKYKKEQMEKQVTRLESEKVKDKKIIRFQSFTLIAGGISILLLVLLFIQQRKTNIEKQKANKKLTAQNNIIGKQKRELEKLNTNKDKFFSIIAHDLKSPFNSLIGFIDLLIKSGLNLPKEKSLKYLNLMGLTAKSTHGLLLNLLSWARAQMNSLECKMENVTAKPIIETEIEYARNIANIKAIAIENLIDAGLTCQADKEMLGFIIRNLLSNAIKYSNEKSTITVNCESTGDYQQICVADNGIGIDPNIGNAIFNSTNTRSVPGTQGEKGTGLGLLMCKEYVQCMGGKI